MPEKLPAHIKQSFKKQDFYAFLIRYVERRFPTWQTKYAHVAGLNIARKIRKRKKINRYAIVFHVSEKTNQIAAARRIPTHFMVTYKGTKRKVPTDVIKTGHNELTYIRPGQNAFERNRFDRAGSMGPIVQKNNQPFVLSNMHVLGLGFLENNQRTINKTIPPGAAPDVNCRAGDANRPVGVFQSGIVNSRIDAAVAFIPASLRGFINSLNNMFTVTDPIILPEQVISNPFSVQMLGSISGLRSSKAVSAIGIAIFNYPFGEQTIIKLIQLSPCCNEPGDSGSAVFDPFSRRIIGIVLGRDFNRKFTYVIPYQAIREALSID